MLHTDIPTRGELERLAAASGPWCVSIYAPTEPAQTPEKNRLGFYDQVRRALERVDDKYAKGALRQEFDDLLDDTEYWRYLSETLIAYATPDSIRTYRVPNRLDAELTVADRFYIKPALRAITFPQDAFILALAENAVRLVEITRQGLPEEISVPGVPENLDAYFASTGPHTLDRLGTEGAEGRKARVRQYCRAVDRGLRGLLTGHEIPLILAAAEPTDSLYRSVNSYSGLLADSIAGNPEHLADLELADRARAVLDAHYAVELAQLRTQFDDRRSEGKALIDISDIARAATYGAVEILLVDIDVKVPGTVAEDGAVDFGGDDTAAGVIDEIARRVLFSSGRVLAVRAADLPVGAHAVAAVLRYSV